jgi:4-hydroxy 2-oxovalerate aldolase
MRNIKILDCTLRDGGYINKFEFGYSAIGNIIVKLVQSGIDIVECGFLVSGANDLNKTQFQDIASIKQFIGEKKQNVLYVAMIQYGAISDKEITPCDGTSIDGIRLTFHEHEIDDSFLLGEKLIKKGYKLFMQPVGTNTYSDYALLTLIKKINEMKPYAFYLVDTLGTMYKRDLLRMFYLIDHNLDKNIVIGFHSHNNLQLSFSNAQELILLNSPREIILDTSVFGMGRGAGNLCTELLIQYINENINHNYEIVPVLEIIDTYINPIYAKYTWGYSAPYYIASINNCHPNYAAYLINKQTITIKDIDAIIKSIDDTKRTLYDEAYITELYFSYQKHTIDDNASLRELRSMFADKTILMLAPGKSIAAEQESILDYIGKEKPLVCSINFIPDSIKVDCVFISNLRRFRNIEEIHIENEGKIIVTSNVMTTKKENCIIVNYTDYLNSEAAVSDNAGLMFLNLLYRLEIRNVVLGGFDGFSLNKSDNYFSDKLLTSTDNERLQGMNKAMSNKLRKMNLNMNITFLTQTIYNEINEWHEI